MKKYSVLLASLLAVVPFSVMASGVVVNPTPLVSQTLPSQYMIGPSSPSIATFNIFSTSSSATITELKFTTGGTSNAVTSIAITSGNVTLSAPVIGNVADISGLNIPVPAGFNGVNVTVTPTYSAVGGTNGISSNSPSTINLTYVKSIDAYQQTSIITPNISSGQTIYLVASLPHVAITNNTKNNSNSLVNGQVELADVTVSADAAGQIKIQSIPLTITTTGSVNLAGQSLIVKDANNNVITTASANLVTAPANSTALVAISFNPSYQIGAGSAQTFKIFANVQGVAGMPGTQSITTNLGLATSFLWSDVNGNATGLTGQYLAGYGNGVSVVVPVPQNPTVTFSNSSFLATNQSLPTNQLGNLVPLAAIDVNSTDAGVINSLDFNYSTSPSSIYSNANNPPVGYTVLTDTQGNVLAQGDTSYVAGRYPIRFWNQSIQIPKGTKTLLLKGIVSQYSVPAGYNQFSYNFSLVGVSASGNVNQNTSSPLDIVTFTNDPAPVPTPTPITSISGIRVTGDKPTLTLKYDATNHEASLAAKETVTITAGKNDIYIAGGAMSLNRVGGNSITPTHGFTPNYVSQNFSGSAANKASVADQFGNVINGWKIKAGKTASFDLNFSVNPQQMFAGVYTVSLGSAAIFDAKGNYLIVPVTSPSSKSVTVVGESGVQAGQVYLAVTSPKAGGNYTVGPSKPIPFSWQWSGTKAPLQPTAYLLDQGSSVVYSKMLNGGAAGTTFNDNIPYNGIMTTGHYRIMVCEYPQNTNNSAYPTTAPTCASSDSFKANVTDNNAKVNATTKLSQAALNLVYDSSQHESSLQGGQAIDIKAGGSDILVTNVGIGLKGIGGNIPIDGALIPNGTQFNFSASISPETKADVYGTPVTIYRIKANTTAHFSTSIQSNPQLMYGGLYTAGINYISVLNANGTYNQLAFTPSYSSSVIIVGEIASSTIGIPVAPGPYSLNSSVTLPGIVPLTSVNVLYDVNFDSSKLDPASVALQLTCATGVSARLASGNSNAEVCGTTIPMSANPSAVDPNGDFRLSLNFTNNSGVVQLIGASALVNGQVQDRDAFNLQPTGATPIPQPTSPATASVNGTPSLALAYDSAQQEVLLRATYNVSVKAGSQNVNIYSNAPISSLYDQNSNPVYAGSQRVESFSPINNNAVTNLSDDSGVKMYGVAAGKTVEFKAVVTINPKVLFAGTYNSKLLALYANLGNSGSNGFKLNVPANQTNNKTIVGEVSPYITGVTSVSGQILAGQKIVVNGKRLLDTKPVQIIIDGSFAVNSSIVDGSKDGTTLFFVLPSTITSGYHYLTVTTSKGSSNTASFTVSQSTITTGNPATANLSSAVLSLVYDTSHHESSLQGSEAVDITAGSSDALVVYVSMGLIGTGGTTANARNGVVPNNTQYRVVTSIPQEIVNNPNGGTLGVYRVKAGTTGHFTSTITSNPQQMYSGIYTTGISYIGVINSDGSFGQIPFTPASSNSMTIVGESSNTITTTSSPVSCPVGQSLSTSGVCVAPIPAPVAPTPAPVIINPTPVAVTPVAPTPTPVPTPAPAPVATPKVPARPSTPSAVMGSSCGGLVSITWKPVPGATSYNIYRSSRAEASTFQVVAPNVTGLNYIDTAGRAIFYYKITAVNAGGESEQSPADAATGSKVCLSASALNSVKGVFGNIFQKIFNR